MPNYDQVNDNNTFMNTNTQFGSFPSTYPTSPVDNGSGLFSNPCFIEVSPMQSSFKDDVFGNPTTKFPTFGSEEREQLSPPSYNNFPLANKNLDYFQQNTVDDLNIRLDAKDTKRAKEKEEKKKGLKWTNVTNSVTMKYAKEPKIKPESQLPISETPIVQEKEKVVVKNLVNRWKCTKFEL